MGGETFVLVSDARLVPGSLPLTGAERAVVALVARGVPNAAIAVARRTSENTVANQLKNVFRKLGVSGRIELVALLAQSGGGRHVEARRDPTTAAYDVAIASPAGRAALSPTRARAGVEGAGPRRCGSISARALWRGLLAGVWSLVAAFEHEERRFLVARRNPRANAPSRALTPREQHVVAFAAMGHSNKLAAHALGLTEGAVSAYLSGALRKIGLATRADLVLLGARTALASLAPQSGHRR